MAGTGLRADATRGRPQRREIWFRVVTIGASLLIFWGIPEAIVRIINPPLEAFRAIDFGGDPNSPCLFMKDVRLGWKLRPNTEVKFLGSTVRTNRYGFRGEEPGAGGRVVLCLGDSTVFGWGVPQSAPFPVQLQMLLNASARNRHPWTVINAGVPGYSSYQLRLQAERLVPAWRPELVIICVGNNEVSPVERSDYQQFGDGRDTIASVITRILSASRFLVWASEAVRRETPKPFIAPAPAKAVPRVSEEEFAANLRGLVQIARRGGARVILVGPPVNLYFPPLAVEQLRAGQGSPTEEWRRHDTFIQQAIDRRELKQAMEAIDLALADSPGDHYFLWQKGFVLTALGQVDAGREFLEQAFERNPFPERCKRSYRQTIAQIAQEERIAYFDINGLFAAQTRPYAPAKLYKDWCHPTIEGHRLIAKALSRVVMAGNYIPLK
jgi:lysophospholipase L1-like esterase